MTPWTIKGVLSLDLSKVRITLQAKAVDPSFGIQQVYLQHENYALWEVIEFGDSYKDPPEETTKDKGLAGKVSASTKKKRRTVAITAEDMQKRKNDTFGGNEATKKTKKNQLKHEYGNFKAEGSETLEQTFNRLHDIVSHIEFMDVPIEQDDLNQMFLICLAPEWLVYTIVWRNRDDLGTMSLDDVYNHLKVYEPGVQKRAGSNSQNMAFISSSNTSSEKTGFDKSKVECFNCHKMGHFAREYISPRSQDRGKRESYKKDPKVEEPAPKAMIAIDGIGWDWSYMADEDEASNNHALAADEEEGVGFNEYCVVSPPSAQAYSPPKKDLSWMGLPEFVDDTLPDYTRPTPSIDVSKSVSKELEERWKSNNPSFFEQGGSSDSGCSRHMTGNISCLSEYEPFNGGYVSFGHGRGKITSKGSIKTEVIMGGEFRNKEMDEFYSRKGIKREFSNARTPQQNGVAERRNRTLIEAARTMLVDVKLPVTFWAEAVNIACYVQNKVLVIKPHNKTPYELFNERSLAIGFLRPFGCQVMILNTLDHLGKFDVKGDEGYFVGYSLSRTGLDWLFDIDTLTNSMNYVPVVVVVGTSSTTISGTKEDVHQAVKEKESPIRFISLPNWFHEAQMATSNEAAKKDDAIPDNNAPQKEQEEVNGDKEFPESSGNSNHTASTKVSTNDSFELASSLTMETEVPTVSTPVPTSSLSVPLVTSSVPKIISKGGSSNPEPLSLGNAMSFVNRLEDFFGDTSDAVSLNDVEADLNNMETAIQVSPTPTLRIHKDHPKSQIIGPIDTPYCLFSCFLSQEKPKKIVDALKDPSWVEAMQQDILPKKNDEKGIVIRNMARLVAQGHTQEEGIDYKEVFSPVARIEAIRLFLAYACYMGFTVYQMDVKSAFLYGNIDEEVCVMQPPGF
nr:hypothetical protein [Tanacetum cinerariifolium]